MALPSILDPVPFTANASQALDNSAAQVGKFSTSGTSSQSFTYVCPAGGSNRLLLLLAFGFDTTSYTFSDCSWNGNDLRPNFTHSLWTGAQAKQSYFGYSYLVNPTAASGTFSAAWNNGPNGNGFMLMTLQDVNQSTPIDVTNFNNAAAATSNTVSITLPDTNYLLLDCAIFGSGTLSYSTFTTLVNPGTTWSVLPNGIIGYKNAASTSESSQANTTSSSTSDHGLLAIKSAAPAGVFTRNIIAGQAVNRAANY